MSRCRTAILPENRGILFISMAKEVKPIVLSEDFKIGALGHTFNVSIAKAFGLTEAILLQNFYHWHQCNKGNDEMFKDGRVWFFRSVAQIVECYPYLSPDKVRYAIERLIESGFLFKGNYSDDKLKKASWYSLSDRTLSLFGENNTPFGKTQNDLGNSQLNYSIEDINNNEKEKEIDKSISKKKDECSEFVDYIYSLYPTKCPCRNKSLGKSIKDKKLIKRLLSVYSKEEIEAVVKKEIEEKYGKSYMRNFSTFLNNFPDPSYIEVPVSTPTENKGTICINGQVYR